MGAFQALAPRAPPNSLRVDDAAPTRHFFGTVAMFMACTGGALLDTTGRPCRPGDDGGTEVGASAAVFLGVRRGVMAAPALAVSGFDALSGLLALDRWRRLR